MADPFDPGNGDPLGGQGPIPKPGQTVPPTNIPAEMARAREQAVQLGADITGVQDVRQVLSGETPAFEALGGAIPMALGGPEARAAERGVAKAAKGARGLFPGMAERYPEVGPPILRDAKTRKPIKDSAGGVISQQASGPEAQAMVDAGKAFWGKELTSEAKAVQKARGAAQKEIDLGNYTPYFKVSERSNVNPTRYPPYKSTVGQLPAKPETIKKYTAMASNPEGVKRLQNAYEHGLTLPNASNWYFMHQLEQEFIKEYGELGPEMFKRRVADALAATTGGADPAANVMTAHYGNYIAARGEQFPTEAHQVPFPIGGGKYGIMPNIDEQMARLFDPKLNQPEHYGPYQQVLNDLAEANGVDPRYFQEVAWSGAKSMIAKGGKGGEYVPKPLIQEYNEAIERTSRITGVPPAEVVRRGIVRAEMPLYGTAGVIGVGQAGDEQQPAYHPILQIDPAATGLHAAGPGVARLPKPAPGAKAASHVIDVGIEQQHLSDEAQTAFGAGAE